MHACLCVALWARTTPQNRVLQGFALCPSARPLLPSGSWLSVHWRWASVPRHLCRGGRGGRAALLPFGVLGAASRQGRVLNPARFAILGWRNRLSAVAFAPRVRYETKGSIPGGGGAAMATGSSDESAIPVEDSSSGAEVVAAQTVPVEVDDYSDI